MLRSFKYRLSPTKAQSATLFTWLRLNRELYNAALQERRDAWQKQSKRISCHEQFGDIAEIRRDRPDVGVVPVVVLRGTLRRLDRAFQAFFRRCKAGEKPGYPRFKNRDRYTSLLIDDLTGVGGGGVPIVAGGKRVSVPLLGKVKVKLHRPMLGKPKAMRITFAAGHWYVAFACDGVPTKLLPPSERDVGIDLGIAHFIGTSDGDVVDVPHGERVARIALERASRRVSRRKRGSRRRSHARVLLARHHAHVANVRRERHIVLARALVAVYGVIYHEDLNICGLARGMLAKQVNEAAWGDFLHWLRVKAEEAGRVVVAVAPRYTSQTCPQCGTVKRKALSERTHRCDCGCVLDRDVAAAMVIREAGRASQGAASPVRERRRSAKSKLATSTGAQTVTSLALVRTLPGILWRRAPS